jgi:hypothetical protein
MLYTKPLERLTLLKISIGSCPASEAGLQSIKSGPHKSLQIRAQGLYKPAIPKYRVHI